MIEKHLDIPTADGAMNSFIVYPEENGPFPVVLFYMDAPGKREELHDMARRIAAVGYYVILPNLYYRRTRDFWLKERTEAAMAEMFMHMYSLNSKTNHCDTNAMLNFIDTQPETLKTSIGAVGYCMSGPFVIWAAAAHPERIHCIASIHGANLVTTEPDSPHIVASKIKCESYVACADNDKWAPEEAIALLEVSLKTTNAPYRIEWFPKAEHGFVFPLRQGIYKQAAAERHWERLFSLFQRRLR
jgi:carboxymethylenebutenolidase